MSKRAQMAAMIMHPSALAMSCTRNKTQTETRRSEAKIRKVRIEGQAPVYSSRLYIRLDSLKQTIFFRCEPYDRTWALRSVTSPLVHYLLQAAQFSLERYHGRNSSFKEKRCQYLRDLEYCGFCRMSPSPINSSQ